MYFYFFLNFINKGLFISLPLLIPVLREQFPISAWEVGAVNAVVAAASVLVVLLLATIWKRANRKVLLIGAIASYVAASVLLALSANVIWLYAVAALVGIGSGLIETLSDAQISRIAQKGKTAQTLASLGMWGDTGRILFSSTIVIVALAIGVTWVGMLFAGASAIFLFIFLKKKEAQSHTTKTLLAIPGTSRLSRQYWIAVAVKFFDSFSSGGLFIFLPYLLLAKGIELKETGLLSALYFFGYMAGRRVFSLISDRTSTTTALRVAEVAMAAVILALVFAAHTWLLLGLIFVAGACVRGTSPIIKAMTSHAMPDESDYERGHGISQFTGNTAGTLNRLLCGWLFGVYGISSVFVLSAIVALLAIAPTFFSRKTSPY